MRIYQVRLSEQTNAIMEVVAGEWKCRISEVLEQCLMRDAATMSGWPGGIGLKARIALGELADDELKTRLGGADPAILRERTDDPEDLEHIPF